MTEADRTGPMRERPFFVVGIGASAGGLDALRALIGQLPGNANAAVLIAQHMSPQHHSLLTELLGRETELPVLEVKGGETLQPNRIFICPPNADLTLDGRCLRLTQAPRTIGPKPSIDNLFNSLAAELGEHAVGIILSGTGSDGAHGSRAIRAAGGLTIAQDPQTAQYDAMPQAAIDQGGAEVVLPPETIGKHLASLLSSPRGTSVSSLSQVVEVCDGPLGDVINGVWKRLRLDFSKYKESTIGRQIDRRITALQLHDVNSYAAYAREHPEELDALAKSFLISVTAFFRDTESFARLGMAIDRIVDSKAAGESVRAWVPGCATGEEAYSIAILLDEAMERMGRRLPVQIFATDVDADAMGHARRAHYVQASLDGVEPVRIQRYFTETRDGYQLVEHVRSMVVFARQDLITDPPFFRQDLISCRNLLIYFKPELQERLFQVFHYALNPGGILFLGRSEAVIGSAGLFTRDTDTDRVFRRNDLALPSAIHLAHFRPKPVSPGVPPAKARPAELDPKTALRDQLARIYGPPSVLIDPSNRLLQLFGDVQPYFQLAEGPAELDVLRLVRPDLRMELRALMHRVRHSQTRDAVSKAVKGADADAKVRMRVRQLAGDSSGSSLLLSFEPARRPEAAARAACVVDGQAAGPALANRVAELEDELASTREHLQTVIEELETSNQELQSLNEELQASGEELQASNEELATSNEELQASNEELSTVNDELQSNGNALSSALADLRNIQDAMPGALVVVDRDLLVTRFNSGAVRVMGLAETDIGRNLTALPVRLQIPHLHDRLRATLSGEQPDPMEVSSGAETYRVELLAYRDRYGQIAGSVLSLVDISDLKRKESALREADRLLKIIAGSLDAVIWIQEPGFGRMLYVSPAYRRIFGLDPEMLLRDPEHMFKVMHRSDAEAMRAALTGAREGPISLRSRITHPDDGGLRWLGTRAFPVRREGRLCYYAGITLDVTDEATDLERIDNLGHVFDLLLDSAEDGVVGCDTDGRILFANQAGVRLLGLERQALIGSQLSSLFTESDCATLQQLLAEQLTAKSAARRVLHHCNVRLPDGEIRALELMVSSSRLLLGGRSALTLVLRDETSQQALTRQLRLAASVFGSSQEGILVLDGESRAIAVNPALCAMLQVSAEHVIGKVPPFFRSSNPRTAFSQEVWDAIEREGRWNGEIHTQRGDREFVVLEVAISSLEHSRGDDEGRYLAMVTDITERRESERIIHRQANFDMLTGLPNRTMLQDRLAMEINHAEREGHGLTLMFIDLDRFKEVNDSLGHEAGDRLLAEATRRIRGAVRESDTLSRFGGDEFVLVLPKYHRTQLPDLTARKVLEVLEEPFYLDGCEVYISASIGVAVYPQDGMDSSELLRNADAAMYKAKEAGRKGYAFYQPELNRDAVRRMSLESDLHHALKKGELGAHYQPILDNRTGRVCALEALARWRHDQHGTMLPGRFIQFAEEAGFIDAIFEAVLDDIGTHIRGWRDLLGPELRVSINFSGRQLRKDSFKSAMRARFSDLSGFVVEVTESLLLDQNEARVQESLKWLCEQGALIALDDFGTGYSSLAYMRRFPVDLVKIDREFVADAPDNRRDAALVQSAVAMAHGVGALVVAEGVETERQAETMRRLGADRLQGFLYSEPLPGAEIVRCIDRLHAAQLGQDGSMPA